MQSIPTKPLKPYDTPKDITQVKVDIDYDVDAEELRRFLLFFREAGSSEPKYLNSVSNTLDDICIDVHDIMLYNSTVGTRVRMNTRSYLRLLYQIVDGIRVTNGLFAPTPFVQHRVSRFKEKFPGESINESLGYLIRSYQIQLRSTEDLITIRDLNSSLIGSLIYIEGIVIRSSQVKPCVRVATYICEACGTETYQQIEETNLFDVLTECKSEKCKQMRIRGALCLMSRGSKFLKYQQITIQEKTNSVPQGCIPRILLVDAYGDLTERVRPGEAVKLCGVFMPRPYYGYKKLKAGLLNDYYLYATDIGKSVQIEASSCPPVTNLDLVSSFAPELYGMDDVKKLLLLVLISSPGTVKADGLSIRGDINLLVVGDPGIAKSQLLKRATALSGRGVYTTGRSSSAAGLTAGVVKDPITNEFNLEGGALVLADGGLCCIDEFDKMNDYDRIAIHEVMEQQSISISKAGINTTLNARCSVVAAANPVKGRYDHRRSVETNINLPVSLMSRFDVILILRDDAEADRDMALATHVTSIHTNTAIPPNELPIGLIRDEIARRRNINVKLPRDLKNEIIAKYVEKRKQKKNLTPRYILSVIRLAMAHARLVASVENGQESMSSGDTQPVSIFVKQSDVDEAIRLLDFGVSDSDRKSGMINIKQEIFNSLCQAKNETTVDLIEFYQKSSYSKAKIDEVIEEFEAMGIWFRQDDELIIVE